jgi:hypothetical protein
LRCRFAIRIVLPYAAESCINTSMEHKYLLAKARNTVTGATVKTQDLTGTRLTLGQRHIAQELAQQLADRMTARTGETWVGFCEAYTPTTRSV